MKYFRYSPFVLLLAMVLSILYLYFFSFRATVEVEVSTDTTFPGFFKVYWAGPGKGYSERNMREFLVTPHKKHYSMSLGNLGSIAKFRIDPIEYQGTAKIGGLTFSQMGYEPIRLAEEADFLQIKPLSQIASINYQDGLLEVVTSGDDGQLELHVQPQSTNAFPAVHIINVVIIFLLAVVVGPRIGFLFRDDLYVPFCMLIVLVLCAIMATLTGLSVHPDEQAHLAAVSYYSDHLWPPRIDSPDIANSYSVYGYTRLANFEIYYPLAGYFGWVLKPFYFPDLLNARLFGLVLFAALTIWSFICRPIRAFVIPLLISAQTWYLFSYSNSESLALAVAVLVAYQAAFPESTLNRYLTRQNPDRFWICTVLLGLMVGMLLLVKSNFYFFILFLGGYLLIKVVQGDYPDQKLLWKRLVLIASIGVSLYGVRVGLDYWANGPDPAALRAEMIEKYSEPVYRPSTPLHEQHIHLSLKDRGFSLDRILHKEQWGGKTFLTAFGAYGFTEYFASQTFYDLIWATGIIMICFLATGILIKGNSRSHWVFLLCVGIALMLIGMLLWRSWTISFQPQGRYLAPILPMLGVLYYHSRKYIQNKIFMTLTVGLFLLAAYSFIFIGLRDIDKIALLI